MAPFPKFSSSQPGGSLGWARMHSIPTISKDPDDAWKLQQYAGGKDKEGVYYTAKRWYILKGLGFGWKPLLDDPEIIASTKKWGDPDLIRKESGLAKGRQVLQSSWYADWEQFFWSQLQDALLQRTPPKDALKAAADKAVELKSES
jgi:multiple sugar transport system substrate-binding protein